VDVRVVFADGEEVRERWDGRDRWKLFEYERPARAVRRRSIPTACCCSTSIVTNNSATLAPRAPEAARKWSLAWLIWLQDHLLTYGFSCDEESHGLKSSASNVMRALGQLTGRLAAGERGARPRGGDGARDPARRAAAVVRRPRRAIEEHLGRAWRRPRPTAPASSGGRSSPRRRPAWPRPSARRSSASGRCSTTSTGCSTTSAWAPAIAGVTAAWLVAWSFLSGACSTGWRGDGRRERTGSSPPAAAFLAARPARGRSRSRCMPLLFSWVHGWLFQDVYPLPDARHDRRAHGIRRPAGRVPALRRAAGGVSPRSSTSPGCASSSRIAAARSGRCSPGARFVRRRRRRPGAVPAFNGIAFLLLAGALRAAGRRAPRARGWRAGARSCSARRTSWGGTT
jgi:hypothetical protein